jgi:hypothetical protein
MDDRPEIEDCVTIAQFNELRRNIEERANGLANDLQAILQQLQHIPHVAENGSNHEDDVMSCERTTRTPSKSCFPF